MTKMYDAPFYPYVRHGDQDAARPAHHQVCIVGAGPVGLTLALDLALKGVQVLVLDAGQTVSDGSRAICFAKRQLEILDRIGCGEAVTQAGLAWDRGKVFARERLVYAFDLMPEAGHRRPAFVNLQQHALERILIDRLRGLQDQGVPIDLRGGNKVEAVGTHDTHVMLEVETPEGSYTLDADWVVACDGAHSTLRRMLGEPVAGQVFHDHFLIADVVMHADAPTERLFWFDPPFNPGQSALLHRQPGNVWRIDLQLGQDIDRSAEMDPARVTQRVRAMLGPDVAFTLDWVSIYSFQCQRMQQFRHGRVLFAGDSAHQVSPFGARGANSGLQDADNLAWKLQAVIAGQAPDTMLDSYDQERIAAADENIRHSTRATEFITPKSEISRLFRDQVLALAADHAFARPLVNTGRLSTPCTYDGSPLNSADALDGPEITRPGAACPDAPLGDGFLLDRLGDGFILLTIDADAPEQVTEQGVTAQRLAVSTRDDPSLALKARYLGGAPGAVYLIRPDQHVAARRPAYDDVQFRAALRRATGQEATA